MNTAILAIVLTGSLGLNTYLAIRVGRLKQVAHTFKLANDLLKIRLKNVKAPLPTADDMPGVFVFNDKGKPV